jgi:hypothetical protein
VYGEMLIKRFGWLVPWLLAVIAAQALSLWLDSQAWLFYLNWPATAITPFVLAITNLFAGPIGAVMAVSFIAGCGWVFAVRDVPRGEAAILLLMCLIMGVLPQGGALRGLVWATGGAQETCYFPGTRECVLNAFHRRYDLGLEPASNVPAMSEGYDRYAELRNLYPLPDMVSPPQMRVRHQRQLRQWVVQHADALDAILAPFPPRRTREPS